jgi:hypothetical protein
MHARTIGAIGCLILLCACGSARERGAAASQTDSIGTRGTQSGLQNIIRSAPKLSLQAAALTVQPPSSGWQLGRVSWIAADRSGLLYLFQRGDTVDPIVVVDRDGHVVRSWGKGLNTMAHAIRIDPAGNIWTADAATSLVRKFDPEGRKFDGDRRGRTAIGVHGSTDHPGVRTSDGCEQLLWHDGCRVRA